MKIARVVGNVVSTIKQETHYGRKMMIIEYVDLDLKPIGPRVIALDACDAGVGDIVIVNLDGGSAKTMHNDRNIIADITICGVLEHFSVGDKIVKVN